MQKNSITGNSLRLGGREEKKGAVAVRAILDLTNSRRGCEKVEVKI
jgi:hypothetical protein